MNEPYQENHGAFLLKCAPETLTDGRYRPTLVATRLNRFGSRDIDVELPSAEPFPIAASAAEFALGFGKRWVRDQVLPSSGPR